MPREYRLEQTRNIGIMAHIDAGKTTTTERILFYTGKTIRSVRPMMVAHQWTGWPRSRREVSPLPPLPLPLLEGPPYQHYRHPGHVDFTVEVERSLRVLDGSVTVFCAKGGVEPQSEPFGVRR